MTTPTPDKTYAFKLLTEEAVNVDLFEDKTHERVAHSLCNLIANQNCKGQTVGLEGTWGSGKSTVVAILKNKLEAAGCKYFYFDAWAHEGDPLRRIFLESIIDKLAPGNKKLGQLKEKIANRTCETKTLTKRYPTLLGRWIALTLFFVPLGAGIVSAIDYSDVTVKWGASVHYLFLIGGLLSLLPCSVLIANLIHLIVKHKTLKCGVLFRPANWVFLENESDSEQSQEVSSEEEKSSIEFERYFRDIVKELLGQSSHKMILVLDNLDRVNPSDSLRIWATLQTFLQRKNPSNDNETVFDHVWVIVPYDKSGLSKLWQEPDAASGCANEFFDKCFQIRIEVPSPIMTNWESFAKIKIQEALIGWPDAEREEAFDILQKSRVTLSDIPTPRRIIAYINQIGLLRQHADAGICSRSICYYAIVRYLKYGGCDAGVLREKLEKGALSHDFERNGLSETGARDFAGLTFGVSPDKGNQLLLLPIIVNALEAGFGEELKTLAATHGDGFWSVFNHHMANIAPDQFTLNYSKAVFEGLWKGYEDKCRSFVAKARHKSIEFPTTSTIGQFEAHMRILGKKGSDLDNKWVQFIASLEDVLQRPETNNVPEVVRMFKQSVDFFGNCKKASRSFPNLAVQRWMEWSSAVSSLDIPAYQWITPPNSIIGNLVPFGQPGKPVQSGVSELVSYSLLAGVIGWKTFVDTCFAHMQHMVRQGQNIVQSPEICDMLLWIVCRDATCKEQIIQIVKNGAFHNCAFYACQKTSTLFESIAVIMAFCSGSELHTITIPKVGQSDRSVQIVRQFWGSRNREGALKILNLLERHNQFDLIWVLAEDERNKLVGDLVMLACEKRKEKVFAGTDASWRLSAALEFVGHVDTAQCAEIVLRFIAHSNLMNELKSSAAVDIFEEDVMFDLLTKHTDDDSLIQVCADHLGKISKEQWGKALNGEHAQVIPMALTVKKKMSDFALGNGLLDALVVFAGQWAKNELVPRTTIVNEWQNIVGILGKSFMQRYGERSDGCMADAKLKVAKSYFDANKAFMNLAQLAIKERESIENAVEQCVKSGDLEGLEVQDAILEAETEVRFVPDVHIVDVLIEPLKVLYSSLSEEKHRSLIERIASKFGVDLKSPATTI